MMVQDNHGGNLYRTVKQYGIKEENILDFSANINPLGLSQPLREMLIDSIDSLVNYPDPECNELRENISAYLGVPKDNIITGNGASEMIYLLFDVLKPLKILIPAPCFSEYAASAAQAGAEVCYYELKEENDFRLDITDFIAHLPAGIDTVMLCNPNNPTSTLINRVDLLTLIECTSKRNINIIIDEAFIELTAEGNSNSVTNCLQQYGNLFIIRALTKILAIPGLRVGYVLGEAQTIRKMWSRKIPWSVNTFACGIGKLLTEHPEYFQATARWLVEEQEWLYRQIEKIMEIKVYKPDTNFILFKISDSKIKMSSALLKEKLLLDGILIRDAGNFKFLDNRFVRVAIKDRASNVRLVEALKNLLCN